jgi:hypothetical protein
MLHEKQSTKGVSLTLGFVQEGENFSTGIEKVRQGEQECPDGFFVIIRHLEQLPGYEPSAWLRTREAVIVDACFAYVCRGCEGRRELTAWNDLLEAKIGYVIRSFLLFQPCHISRLSSLEI